MLYILTNSYPEKRKMFTTYEIEYLNKHYKNKYKVISFSKISLIENSDVINISVTKGIFNFFKFKKKLKVLKLIFKISGIDLREFVRSINSAFLALDIISKIEFDSKDIIYSYWLSRSSVIAYFIHEFKKIDFIIQGHGSDIYIYPPKKIKSIASHALKVFTIGEKNKSYISDQFDIELSKIIVFKLGVSNDFGSFNSRIFQKKIKFVTIARYEKVKGIDILLEAAKIISNNHDIEFHIYGEGSQEKKYRQYINENSLNEFVFLNEWISQEEIPEILTKSDCFILPSISEGVPVVLMEACAYSLPIIAADVGGVSEVAFNSLNAITYTRNNANTLANSIQVFLNLDNNKKTKMAAESYNIYKKKYRLEANLYNKYEYIYNNKECKNVYKYKFF